jgi:uncharacterized protein
MIGFVSRHPIIFSVLAVFLAVVVIQMLGAGLPYLKLSQLAIQLTIEGMLCGYVISLLVLLKWWREAGFKQAISRPKLLAYLPLLFLPIAVLVTNGFKPASASEMILFTFFTLLVGFAEEGLLRGVVLRAMVPSGITRAVVLSSLLFGLGHLINILEGASPATTIVQITYSTLLGIGFAGARLYTGTIWPVIVVHTLIDFVDVASRGFVLAPPQSLTLAGAIVPILITGLYALYGWWLLRRMAKVTQVNRLIG